MAGGVETSSSHAGLTAELRHFFFFFMFFGLLGIQLERWKKIT